MNERIDPHRTAADYGPVGISLMPHGPRLPSRGDKKISRTQFHLKRLWALELCCASRGVQNG